MDEQELQRLMQQAFQEIRDLGSVSAETAKKIEAAGNSMADFKKTAMALGAQFTRTMTGLAKSVGEGNTEFTVFNSVVDSVTGALTEMGKSIPFFGAAMVAAGEGAKFLLGQLQATTKAFNQVGDAGLLGAEGMSGLRNQFIEAGIDLQLYTKVVTANSEALARFGGTAGDGAARFSKALGRVNQDFGTQLMSLGNSFEAIAEQTASYIALQTRLGRSQNMTQAQLAKGAFEYAKELDALAKLTGQQKNQIIKQQDAAMSESRFRAKYEDLVAQGRVKEAKAMLDFQSRVSATNAALGQGLRDIAGGFVNTEAAQAAFITTGGRAATIMQQLSEGTISQEQAFAELQAANKQTMPLQRSLAMAVGDMPGVLTPFAQSADFANQKIAEFGRTAATQAAQMAGADGLTQSAVAAQQAMMKFSLAVNELGTQAMESAATAVKKFAEVTTTAIEGISKEVGVQVRMPQRQYAEGGIARGPESGFAAMLHGAEAIVPLPDGNRIPVQFLESPAAPADNGLGMAEQLSRTVATILKTNIGANVDTRGPQSSEAFAGIVRDMVSATQGRDQTLPNIMDFANLGESDVGMMQRLATMQGQPNMQDLAGIKSDSNLAASIENPLARMESLVQNFESQLAGRTGTTETNASIATDTVNRVVESNQQMIQILSELVSLQRNQNGISSKILQASTN